MSSMYICESCRQVLPGAAFGPGALKVIETFTVELDREACIFVKKPATVTKGVCSSCAEKKARAQRKPVELYRCEICQKNLPRVSFFGGKLCESVKITFEYDAEMAKGIRSKPVKVIRGICGKCAGTLGDKFNSDAELEDILDFWAKTAPKPVRAAPMQPPRQPDEQLSLFDSMKKESP